MRKTYLSWHYSYHFSSAYSGTDQQFDDLKETLFGEHSFDAKAISFGLQRILWAFKKLVIADRLLPAVNTIVRNPEEYQEYMYLSECSSMLYSSMRILQEV